MTNVGFDLVNFQSEHENLDDRIVLACLILNLSQTDEQSSLSHDPLNHI